MDDTKAKYYAVRDEKASLILDNWGDAVNHGFIQKQGHGNAVKFNTKKEAEKWVKHKAFPMTASSAVKSYIQKQHFLVRLAVFSLLATMSLSSGFYMLVKLENYLNCRNDVIIGSSSVCVSLRKVSITISGEFNKLIDIILYEVIGVVLIFSSWVVGLL
tara:strand:- start:1599 stop:2075 length:477 start_codon:yes stop_codon:yes gene_type:complete